MGPDNQVEGPGYGTRQPGGGAWLWDQTTRGRGLAMGPEDRGRGLAMGPEDRGGGGGGGGGGPGYGDQRVRGFAWVTSTLATIMVWWWGRDTIIAVCFL